LEVIDEEPLSSKHVCEAPVPIAPAPSSPASGLPAAGLPAILDAAAAEAWAEAFGAPEFKGVPIANIVLSMELTPGATKLFDPAKLSDEAVVAYSTRRIGAVPTLGRYMQNMHQLKIIKPEPWYEMTRKGARQWAVKLGTTSNALHVTGVKKYEEIVCLLDYLADLLKTMAPASAAGGEGPPLIRVTKFSISNMHSSYRMVQPKNMRLSLDDVRTDMSNGAVIHHPDALRHMRVELMPTTKAAVNAIFSENQRRTYTGFNFSVNITSGAVSGTSCVTIFGSGSMLINGKSALLVSTVADMMMNSYLPHFVKEQGAS
jgi:hypothetical protein